MGAHTVGPWVARRCEDRWEIASRTQDFEDLSGVVVGWVETSRPGFSHPTDAADAKLMAAAPDLLVVVEELARAGNASTRAVWLGMSDKWRGEVRAAIAKARGGK